MRDRRRGGWRPPPDADNATTWRLLWVIVGATTFTAITFTAIIFFLDLI